MTQLADRLQWSKHAMLPSTADVMDAPDHRRFVREFLDDFDTADAHINVTNVAEYLLAVSDDEYDTPERDFPNVAPPFYTFWMEFASPRYWNVNGKMVEQPRFLPARWGMLMRAFSAPDGGWQLGFKIVCEMADGKIYNPVLSMSIPIARDGTLPEGPWRTIFIGATMDDFEEAVVAQARFMVKVCLLAISFMHCKNVAVQPQHIPEKLNRAYRRRHDRDLIRFHTIHIEPMKKVLATEGNIAENGLKKALHICRGHWAQYGPQYGRGKLFGKIEGQFWIPAHVRGSAEQGVIDKRYVVHPPKDDAA